MESRSGVVWEEERMRVDYWEKIYMLNGRTTGEYVDCRQGFFGEVKM